MNNIPTAEEFSKNFTRLRSAVALKDLSDFAIEFAKLHVEAALKEALESIPCLGSSSDIATYEEVKDAVLNSYPLSNVK